VNGQAYIPILFGYDIYAVDLSNKQNFRRLGGQGKGPGEFEHRIIHTSNLNNGFAVTYGNWIHFFDENGSFQSRIVLKSVSITSIGSLQGEQLLVGTKPISGSISLSTHSNVGVMNDRSTDTLNFEVFGN